MDNRYRIPILSLIVALTPFFGDAAWSQQPAAEPEPPKPKSVAVLAILETDPSTPAEWVHVAKILADLERPDLGKEFLRKVIDAKLNQRQLADLAEQFGTAMFVEMAARTEMLPEARQISDAVLTAANKLLQDPKRVAALIAKLKDSSPQVQAEAMADLKEARAAAIGPMIDVLADPARADEHAGVRAALVRMRSEAVQPLIGILERSEPKLMAQAIHVLAQLNAKQSVIYLLGPYTSETSDRAVRAAAGAALQRLVGHLPSKPQAVRLLTERAKAFFDRDQVIRADADGQVELWSWDTGKKQCVARTCSAEDAALVLAARLARDAYALAKDDPEVRRLYLATMLEAEAYEAGLDGKGDRSDFPERPGGCFAQIGPVPFGQGTAMAEAGRFGVEVIEDVMEYAMAGDHPAAATASAQLLGKKGTADALLYRDAQPAPLVRACRHPDRRLRMAATAAVVGLQPTKPFPGSSYIPQALAFFAASRGAGRALVAGPSSQTTQTIAGMLAKMRYEVDTATTGRELIRKAIASPDYELAMIDVAIDRPRADFLLQQLRRDGRSATLRVGLFARSGQLERARHVAGRDPMAMAFSRPHTDEALAWQVERLGTLAPRRFVAQAQRQQQAARALDLLARIGGSDQSLYDLRQTQDSVLAALHTDGLGVKVAAVLANLGMPESQRALVEVASRWTQPLELRTAAAGAFRKNTERYGILLTSEEILRQYDRYNQSAALDRGTQRVLGLILDCIEAPTQIVGAQIVGAQIVGAQIAGAQIVKAAADEKPEDEEEAKPEP